MLVDMQTTGGNGPGGDGKRAEALRHLQDLRLPGEGRGTQSGAGEGDRVFLERERQPRSGDRNVPRVTVPRVTRWSEVVQGRALENHQWAACGLTPLPPLTLDPSPPPATPEAPQGAGFRPLIYGTWGHSEWRLPVHTLDAWLLQLTFLTPVCTCVHLRVCACVFLCVCTCAVMYV